jgi:SAM-dependent methyltransferase
MLAIAQFNWPFYVAAVVAALVSFTGFLLVASVPLKVACGVAFGGAAYFLFGSLAVSHFIYDRSDLYRWGWIKRALRELDIRDAIFCHSGFDDASPGLRKVLSAARWQVLDHFDERQMSEPSIRRARAIFPPTPGTVFASYDSWPVPDGSTDVVIGFLAIHELRSDPERSAWFVEAKRCLRQGGRVVLVEHARDAANFLAFGPGFLHFHSPATWRRCWESAGFCSVDEFRVTPFVRIFALSVP